LNEFPRAQIHISLYEDLERAPERQVANLFAFLGVDSGFTPDLSTRRHEPGVSKLAGTSYFLKRWGVWHHLRALVPSALKPRFRSLLLRSRASLAVEPADRAFLADYYRSDIQKLEALLERDLSSWLRAH
jgi:hypothetical protein